MLKCLAILAVLIAAWHIGAQVPRQGAEKQDLPAKNRAPVKNLSPPLAQPTFDLRITIDHEDDGEGKHKATQDQSRNWIKAFWPAPLSNWALVIVGGIAGLLAWLTLRRIRRQTDLMNRNNAVALAAAKAALAQVTLIKQKERAKIVVNVLRLETVT